MGDSEAMRKYGLDIFEHTTGRKDEVDEAIAWITKAAEKENIQAMYDLAMIISAGGRGADPKALFWFRKGAEAGDPNCMVKLSQGYHYGYLGLDKDETQYQIWMGRAMAIDRE